MPQSVALRLVFISIPHFRQKPGLIPSHWPDYNGAAFEVEEYACCHGGNGRKTPRDVGHVLSRVERLKVA